MNSIYILLSFYSIYNTIAFVKARKLVVSSENNGFNIRRNILYINWKDDKTYHLVCGPPPGEFTPKDNNLFTWIPLTKSGYGRIIEGSYNATLAISAAVSEPILEFNCTMKSMQSDFEPSTFRFYKSNEHVLTDTSGNIHLNYTDGSTVLPQLQLLCRPPALPAMNLQNSQVVWFLDNVEIKADEKIKRIDTNKGNGTLTISRPAYVDTGIYMCKMKDDMTVFAFYNVTGAVMIQPLFKAFWDSEVATTGDNITIMHEIHGNPIDSTKIRWQRKIDNKIEDIDDDFYITDPLFKNRLFFNPNQHGPKGELQLNNVQKTDRAEFIMFAENEYGTTNFTTLIRVKGMIDALYPCIGIVVEVVLLVIIIFIFERRRSKKERMQDEDENKNSYGMTALPSSTEDGLRMRKN